jgi:hypothetical protein
MTPAGRAKINRLNEGLANGKVQIGLVEDIKGWTFWIHEQFRWDSVVWSMGPYPTEEEALADILAAGINWKSKK